MPKRIDVKELIETLNEVVKARNIQKAKVDQNKMTEEVQKEEIAKFQKPVVEEVHKIVSSIEKSTKPKSVNPRDCSKKKYELLQSFFYVHMKLEKKYNEPIEIAYFSSDKNDIIKVDEL
jgi:hypothetical protein